VNQSPSLSAQIRFNFFFSELDNIECKVPHIRQFSCKIACVSNLTIVYTNIRQWQKHDNKSYDRKDSESVSFIQISLKSGLLHRLGKARCCETSSCLVAVSGHRHTTCTVFRPQKQLNTGLTIEIGACSQVNFLVGELLPLPRLNFFVSKISHSFTRCFQSNGFSPWRPHCLLMYWHKLPKIFNQVHLSNWVCNMLVSMWIPRVLMLGRSIVGLFFRVKKYNYTNQS
jgi:hypothetical protein